MVVIADHGKLHALQRSDLQRSGGRVLRRSRNTYNNREGDSDGE
jgi:hypothetical protein